MGSITGWQGGRLNSGLGWVTAINSSDLASMANGSSVLSSVADITNGASDDMLMDLSVRCVIASSTIVAGASLTFWRYDLLDDGSTYGDGQLVAGTQAAKTPVLPVLCSIGLVAAASQTALVGARVGLILPPGSFRIAMQNNSGFALTAGTQTVKYRTYNLNLGNSS
jgi:hypothetical protein